MAGTIEEILGDLAAALRTLAVALTPNTLAMRATLPSFAATISNEDGSSTREATVQEFAFNDNQTLQIRGFTPAVVDLGGVQLKKADGSDLTPADVTVAWASVTPAVAAVRATDAAGAAITNGVDITSPAPGRAVVTATETYPDGSTKVTQYGVTIGFSAAGAPTFTSAVVDE